MRGYSFPEHDVSDAPHAGVVAPGPSLDLIPDLVSGRVELVDAQATYFAALEQLIVEHVRVAVDTALKGAA